MTTAYDDVRRCWAARCTGPDGEPRYLRDERLACDGCSERGRTALAGFPKRYVALYQALRFRGGAGERITGPGFTSMSPVRDAALSCMDDMVAVSTRADLEVRAAMQWRARPYNLMRPAAALVGASQSLLATWHRALIYPQGIRALDAAWRLRIRADHVLGWSRLVHRLPAPCPYCDTVSLVRDDGADYVRCTSCQRTWHHTEYRLFVRMLVEEAS